MHGPVVTLVRRLAGGLRYPRLLALTAALFVIDLIVPDAIPLADEVLLGLVTVLLATRRRGLGRNGSAGARKGSRRARARG